MIICWFSKKGDQRITNHPTFQAHLLGLLGKTGLIDELVGDELRLCNKKYLRSWKQDKPAPEAAHYLTMAKHTAALMAQCITPAGFVILAPPPSVEMDLTNQPTRSKPTSQISPAHPVVQNRFFTLAIVCIWLCLKSFVKIKLHILPQKRESDTSSQENALKLDTLSQSTARKMRCNYGLSLVDYG